jgi:hypothetical protein
VELTEGQVVLIWVGSNDVQPVSYTRDRHSLRGAHGSVTNSETKGQGNHNKQVLFEVAVGLDDAAGPAARTDPPAAGTFGSMGLTGAVGPVGPIGPAGPQGAAGAGGIADSNAVGRVVSTGAAS